ncbi:phage tail tape measure protein, partial [Halocynthiibacter namhaensis]
MATGNLNVAMILKLVDQVSGPAAGAVSALRGIGAATEQAGRAGVAWSNEQLAANQARMQGLQSQALGIAATGYAFYQALKPAIEFESAMAGVSKVVDFDSPDGLAQMQEDILAMTTSGALPIAAEGIAAIIEAAGQAGVVDSALPDDEERAQLIAFARDAAQMGVAFDISAEQSGASMAQWRKAMGLSQSQALGLG